MFFFLLQVMESLEHAMKRDAPILAEYLGGSINCDAYHITIPRSDGLNLSACIQNCLVDANVSAEEVLPFLSFNFLSLVLNMRENS